ncbi:monocarboxylate transporter 5-like [Parasteatoda tepidariorum]|uniref:monocarboxylate transporter 5-like n=1 Tax=Parasteatoda tepidariorum TaxID=114398 RepID=UPI001C727156|nr:monocarboxylate transporter 2-like [Parasteatoda tepidariorum]XP_042899335.1 monocarboxylate transporter 2-like [Parasteatoda tepidariorum]XP_042899336.1 monocarboxylate transporter 2-like [Parasteatoda tepidariorum]
MMKKYGLDSRQSWLVVLASCVVKFMTYGPTEIAGMLMVYTMHTFNTTREAASLPYTLVYVIRNGAGPIIAYIGNIIGLRSTTLIGCVLSSIAIGACFFAENVIIVTILWGIVFGFGFAFEGLLLNSITMEHFEINFSKALGITNAGAVLGICYFSPYVDFLVNSFGLSGAFLLLAGATLHSIPAALFMLLNKPNEQTKLYANNIANVSKEYDKITENTNDQKGTKDNAGILNCATSHQSCFGNQQNGSIKDIYSERNGGDTEQRVKTIAYRVYNSEAFETNWNKPNQWIDVPLYSKNGALKFDTKPDSFRHFETQLPTDNQPQKLETNQMMKTLFCHPIFWLILICNGMHYFTLPAFFTLLIDYAIDIGMDPANSQYIVMYSQMAEFVGCLVLGWLADLKLVSSHVFAITLFLCQCGALLLMPLAHNIVFLALVVLVFQWTQTGLSLIYPSVVSDSLEKEIQPSAMASMFILAAPLDLAISPLIGFFRDERGSYTGVYLTLSLAAFIGSLSQLCVLKCVSRRKLSNKKIYQG